MDSPTAGNAEEQASPWRIVGAGLSISVIFVAVVSLPLTTAADLGLSGAETASWIIAVYGLAGLLSAILVLRYRQPLLLTGNIFILLFIERLGDDLLWSEMVGAAVVAGGMLLVLGPLGITDRLTRWLPPAIVFGLLAGLVFRFFVRMFDILGDAPLIVGGTVVVYLAARRLTEPRVPAILPALVAAILLAILGGDIGSGPVLWSWPTLNLTVPSFSTEAVLAATPVMVILITVQANVPSLVYLRSQGYEAPEAVVGAVSGLGTMAGSVFGPTGISLSLPATALCAGPGAGAHGRRHLSVYIGAATSIAIALLAAFAAQLTDIVPLSLLVTIVALAFVDVLSGALRIVSQGPLVIGPLFAFGIAFSELSFLGLDGLFWALVGGIAISFVLERDGWRQAVGA